MPSHARSASASRLVDHLGCSLQASSAQLKQQNILWLATISTVTEARAAEAAGADIIVVQGAEAGGHRGSFVADNAEREQTGLFALLPAVVDAVSLPTVAAGGIADGRGIAAALMLGASAVQIGTGFLRCPEAEIHPAWAAALAKAMPEDTCLTRAFSGRAGRSLVTGYVRAAMAPDAPIQRPILSSVASQPGCGARPRTRVIFSACRPGPDSRRGLQERTLPETSCAVSGRRPTHFSGASEQAVGAGFSACIESCLLNSPRLQRSSRAP